jgi:hypothetical protein
VGIIPTLSFTTPVYSFCHVSEINKLGTTVRSLLYIQLMPFPTHYLVLVVTDTDFRYALISVRVVPEGIYQSLVMEDIGWLDVERICGRGREARTQDSMRGTGFGSPGAESSKSVLEIDPQREVRLTVYQIQIGDHGPARTLYLLLVHIGLSFRLMVRLIAIVQRSCGTHEG